MFNTIKCLTILATFALCTAENSISVTFAVQGCTSDCISAVNPNGKVRIYGYDENYKMQLGAEAHDPFGIEVYEIIEEPFTATQGVPFTLNIPYPDDPVAIIEAELIKNWGAESNNPVYFVDIIWDTNSDFTTNCNGDVEIEGGDPRANAVVDLNSAETQTIYIKQIERQGTCEGSIQVKLTRESCSADETSCSPRVEAGYGKLALYGYDSHIADTAATLIHQQDVRFYGSLPAIVTISFPEDPAALIEPSTDNSNAKFYVTLDRCDITVDNDYYSGVANVDLKARDREQIVYIKTKEDSKCGAACHY
eukprot:248812_1